MQQGPVKIPIQSLLWLHFSKWSCLLSSSTMYNATRLMTFWMAEWQTRIQSVARILAVSASCTQWISSLISIGSSHSAWLSVERWPGSSAGIEKALLSLWRSNVHNTMISSLNSFNNSTKWLLNSGDWILPLFLPHRRRSSYVLNLYKLWVGCWKSRKKVQDRFNLMWFTGGKHFWLSKVWQTVKYHTQSYDDNLISTHPYSLLYSAVPLFWASSLIIQME